MTPAVIPLNDLRRHADSIQADLQAVITEVLARGQYVLGPWVERFESAFAGYCGVTHVVGVGNGTDALELALKALDCGQGDHVVTVANAGGYATNAIINAGATPVYADIDPQTFLMSLQALEQAITPDTKAVIVTHLYGLMADMPALCALAAARGIPIIEDCAQAHGAAIAGKKAGSWGKLGCFSFYPTKNLGALGDAGALVTNDDALAKRIRGLRQYGWQQEKYHSGNDVGRNSRMDELQAAALATLFGQLNRWNAKRRSIVQRYRHALHLPALQFQQVNNEDAYVAHLCVVRTEHRDRLAQFLAENHIATAVHYPVLDYRQPAVRPYLHATPALKHAELLVMQNLSLPCFPELTDDEVARVIDTVRRLLQN